METIYFIYKFDEIEELAIYLVKGLFVFSIQQAFFTRNPKFEKFFYSIAANGKFEGV